MNNTQTVKAGEPETQTSQEAGERTHSGLFDGTTGLEIEMTMNEAMSASHQGDCDDDVAILVGRPHVAAQLDTMGADFIREGLRDSGTWDETELADDQQNRHRAVWLAACDIRENPLS